MDAWSYSLGREQATLEKTQSASDKIFGGQRYDNRKIDGSDFQHCTFSNVSFLKSSIKNARFIDSVFIGCYFRRAEINGCTFIGCRFFYCDFSYLAMHGSSLRYTKFDDCRLDYDIVKHNLPNEHNLREEFCRNLAVQCARLGYLAEARRFRLAEIRAREANLWSAVVWETDWHRRHFDGLRRLKAGFDLLGSIINGYLWGHGEKLRTLVINSAVLAFGVLPVCLWWLWRDFEGSAGRAFEWDAALYMSIELLLPVELGVDTVPITLRARIVSVLASAAGLVLTGLFGAYLLRWILRR